MDRRISKYKKQTLINNLLEKTGLTACAYTPIGDSINGKILSGGEKKRLAFATELLIKPTILFCDEPSTGLGLITYCHAYYSSLDIILFYSIISRFIQCTTIG